MDSSTEAVEEAQAHGVQVVLLTVPTVDGKPHGVSRHLVRASDGLDYFDGASIDAAVMKIDRQPASSTPSPPKPVAPRPAPRPTPPPRTAVPTPLDLATAQPQPTPVRTANTLVYTGVTGSSSQVRPEYDAVADDAEVIDEVVSRILASLQSSSTPEDPLNLRRTRPNIPPDIDRALLLDASDAMQHHDLDEGIRYRLRARFWDNSPLNRPAVPWARMSQNRLQRRQTSARPAGWVGFKNKDIHADDSLTSAFLLGDRRRYLRSRSRTWPLLAQAGSA